jgi:hypothetical protein
VPQPTALLLEVKDDVDLQDSYGEFLISESFIEHENENQKKLQRTFPKFLKIWHKIVGRGTEKS